MKRVAWVLGAWLIATVIAIAPAREAVPRHIPTWAFDEYNGEGAQATREQVRRYLNYAEGGLDNDKAVRDCSGVGSGCASVFYFDPNLIYDSSECPFVGDERFLAEASEDWFIHEAGFTDAAHRVYGIYHRDCRGRPIVARVYVANPGNPNVVRFFARYLQRHAEGWDYFELDDTKDTVVGQMYGPGGGFCRDQLMSTLCAKTEEYSDDGAIVRAHRSFVDAMRTRDGAPMRFFYNGLSFPKTPATLPLLGPPNRIVGAICENCIVNDGSFRPNMYAKVLDAMATIDAIPGAAFVELNTGKSPPGSSDQIAQRLVTTAVAWLGFQPGSTIVWPNLEFNTHDLAVWPEDEIYPSRPLESMRDSADALAVAPGVWRREFAQCFMDGAPIGPCAALLNANAAPVAVQRSWFRLRYAHRVVPQGGDILSGGGIVLAPSDPGTLTIPEAGALLLVR